MDQVSASEISFREVSKLVARDFPNDSAMLGAVDKLLGAVLVLSPAVFGPDALPALALLDAKNELVSLGSAAIGKITSRTSGGFLEKHRRMAAANCLLTYTAFFEALQTELPDLVKLVGLTSDEKLVLTRKAIDRRRGSDDVDATRGGDVSSDLTNLPLRLPHPLEPNREVDRRLELYAEMSHVFGRFLAGLAVWDGLTATARAPIEEVLEKLPERANEAFEARYYQLAVEHEQFFVWATLHEHERTRELALRLSDDLRSKIALVEEASQRVDLGMSRLRAAVEAGPSQEIPTRASSVWLGLNEMHAASIARPIIEDRFVAAENEVSLTYPRKEDIFVPQAFKAIRSTTRSSLHLEDEAVWKNVLPQDDLGPFLVRYLSSPFSTETPLLVLGHPGSGKSLLTEMIAARLAPPHFNVVRVELRDIDPEADLQAQIEEQIRKDTGRDVNWADLASELRDNPPVVVLDGYDELLQASGQVFSTYLTQVRKFQWREAVQGRPIRVIVTSRITLIDKAAIPDGSTVLRLLEFDETRRQQWIDVWNGHNAAYFDRSGVRPFQVPSVPNVAVLAEQPLLLLMLALYDSQDNKLVHGTGLDQSLLYDSLLTRFVEREHLKGESGETFAATPGADRMRVVGADLERLGVAAVGMFNRRQLHIHRDQLDRDIAYFGMQREVRPGSGPRLNQADLLLGSFFFIHESRTRSADPRQDASSGPTAFEFLHNTFGEFLVADFLLRQLLRETKTIGAMRRSEDLRSALDQRLSVLTDRWFACLMYTPLHTRPVILALLREWLPHRLRFEGRRREELLEDLDLLIRAQLRLVLRGSSPPAVMQRQPDTPFDPLPLLGHLAVYSLNLVVLRTVLAADEYAFDERLIDVRDDGTRPWDQLSHVWRAWLPLENLLGLSAVVTSRRRGQIVHLRPRPTFSVPAGASQLDVVLSVGEALADDLLAGLAGIQVYDTSSVGSIDLSEIAARMDAAGIDVSDALTVRAWKEDPKRIVHDALVDRVLGSVVSRYAGRRVATMALEVLNKEMTSLQHVTNGWRSLRPVHARLILDMRRYDASIHIPLAARLVPPWLIHILEGLTAGWADGSGASIAEFGSSAAAGPVVAAATRYPMNHDVLRFARALARSAGDGGLSLPDPEAWVQLAILGVEVRMPKLRDAALRHLATMIEANPSLLVRDLSVESVCWITDLALEHALDDVRGLSGTLRRGLSSVLKHPDWPARELPPSLLLRWARLTGDMSAAFRRYPPDLMSRDEVLQLVRLARQVDNPNIVDESIGSLIENLWPARLEDLTLRQLDDFRWLAEHFGDRLGPSLHLLVEQAERYSGRTNPGRRGSRR